MPVNRKRLEWPAVGVAGGGLAGCWTATQSLPALERADGADGRRENGADGRIGRAG